MNTKIDSWREWVLLSNEEKPSNVSVDLDDISRTVYFDKTNHKIKTYFNCDYLNENHFEYLRPCPKNALRPSDKKLLLKKKLKKNIKHHEVILKKDVK